MSEKLDLKKLYPNEYKAKTEPEIIDTEDATYLSLSGEGAPDFDAFAEGVEAIFTYAYKIKSIYKAKDQGFVVSKLEGLWWVDEGDLMITPRENWKWELLMRVPDYVEEEVMPPAVEEMVKKGKSPLVNFVTLARAGQKKVVQILHKGPYSEEGPSIRKMLDYANEEGYEPVGVHHEIYLSDPRRTLPENIKTILRQPVQLKQPVN